MAGVAQKSEFRRTAGKWADPHIHCKCCLPDWPAELKLSTCIAYQMDLDEEAIDDEEMAAIELAMEQVHMDFYFVFDLPRAGVCRRG